jgi:RsiW-degrading membrane proteinase PrsW (M82 family)
MAGPISPTAGNSESPQGVNGLSLRATLLCWLALPVALATLLAVSPLTAALLPILIMPTAWLLWEWNAWDRGKSADLETMIWLYLINGTVGFIAVVVIESILSYGFAILLFQSQMQTYLDEWGRQETNTSGTIHINDIANESIRKDLASRWQYLLFLALTSFVTAGMVEEGLKYCSLVYIRRYRTVVHESEYITYAMASALGLSTLENIGFIYQACQVESASQLALTLFERVALGAPGHAMTSCLLAINVIRRDLRGERLNLLEMMHLPLFLHGSFNFALLTISAANGNIGWVHPTGGISLVLAMLLAIGMPLTTFLTIRYKSRKHNIRLRC